VSKGLLAVLVALVLMLGALAGAAGCTPTEPAVESPSTQPPPATSTPDTTEARAALLISVDDLAADTAGVVILDSRDPKAYEAGHIEGAISAPWQAFATVAEGKPGDADWGVLSTPDDIAAALGERGVDTTKPIVVYSDPTGWGEDGRVLWTLRSIGVLDVRMLDGGLPAWSAAGKAVSTEVPSPAATTVAVAEGVLADINVTTDEVKAAVDTGGVNIVDARSEKEYGGATDFGEARGGHIPGAMNVPFPTMFNEDGTLKSNDDLVRMFTGAGIERGNETIVYCTKGVRSAYMAEILQMLRYPAKNYDASFYSWAGDPSLPVEK